MTTTTTCARCSQTIVPNRAGGWMTHAGLGHRAILCPDGVHVHAPTQEFVEFGYGEVDGPIDTYRA